VIQLTGGMDPTIRFQEFSSCPTGERVHHEQAGLLLKRDGPLGFRGALAVVRAWLQLEQIIPFGFQDGLCGQRP
jgi:hypothetical protein